MVSHFHQTEGGFSRWCRKNQTEEEEAAPCALLMDCTLFDESNPIMDEYDDLCLKEMLG